MIFNKNKSRKRWSILGLSFILLLVSLIVFLKVPANNIQTNTQAVLTLTILPNKDAPEVPLVKNLISETNDEAIQLNIESQVSDTLFINDEKIGVVENSDGSFLYELELETGENEFNLYAQNYFEKSSPQLEFSINKDTDGSNQSTSINEANQLEVSPEEFDQMINALITQLEESGKISREDKKEFNETFAPLFKRDSDQDGMSDALEYYLGQDPLTEETLFTDEIDILDLNNNIYTNESILLYGQSTKGNDLNIYARDKDLNLHLIGEESSKTEKFAIPGQLPFPGEFTLLLETIDRNGNKEISVKDEIQYKKANTPPIPEPNIQISSSFTSTLQTNLLSFSEPASIVIDGSSLPLQKVLIVWTQNNKHILTQVLTSPIDGSFHVENPFSTNSKNISAKIQIIDPESKFASPLIETEYTLKEFELKTHLLIHSLLIVFLVLILKAKSRKTSIINKNA